MSESDVRLVVWGQVTLAALLIASPLPWGAVIAAANAHEGLAGWAQFGGATISLGVALYVAYLPLREVRRHREEDQRRVIGAAAHAALLATGTIDAWTETVRRSPDSVDEETVRETFSYAMTRLEIAASTPSEAYAATQQIFLLTTALRGARDCALAAPAAARNGNAGKVAELIGQWQSKAKKYAVTLIQIGIAWGLEFEGVLGELSEGPLAPKGGDSAATRPT